MSQHLFQGRETVISPDGVEPFGASEILFTSTPMSERSTMVTCPLRSSDCPLPTHTSTLGVSFSVK